MYQFYQAILESHFDDFKAEFALWVMKWKNFRGDCLPSGALEALNSCSPDLFPTIHMLLKVNPNYYEVFSLTGLLCRYFVRCRSRQQQAKEVFLQ